MRTFVLILFLVSVLVPVASVAQCGPDSTLTTMFITVDAWGEENYWELVPSGNACGVGTLYFGANEMVGCEATPPEGDGGYPDNTIVEVPSFCLATGELFDLIFVDSYGDGGPIFELYENGSFAHAFFGAGSGNTWTFEAGNSGLPAYDSPCGALEIVPNGEGVAIDNSDCVAQSAEPRPQGLDCGLPGAWCEGNITNTAWAYFVAEPGFTYEITSCNEGGDFDTQLALYKANGCLGWESFELIGANDDMAGGCSVSNGYSSLFYASCLEAGEVYYIQIDGWEASIGSAVITVRTVEVDNELQAIFNNIRCPIAKGEIPQSSILPYFTGSGSNFDCEWIGPGFFSTDQNIVEIGPGIYSLTATDACGETFQASFEVTQPDLWNITTTEVGPTCEATSNGALLLTVNGATPPYSFEWIGPSGFTSGEQDLFDIFAGNYQITVTDINECTSSAYVILEPENSFNFNLGSDTTLCLNEDYLLVAPPGLFYVWQDQSINQFYNIDAEIWGIGQHAVVLTATTPEGCVYADDLVFTVQDCSSLVQDWSEAGWNLYPNPSTDVLNLEWSDGDKPVYITLTDMQGRVADQTFSQGYQKLVWNPSVVSGTYQVVVETEGKRYFSRWTKCN